MLELFHKEVDAKIRRGVALHDAGKYDEALKLYDSILKDYPNSAWARYERFHTRRTVAQNNGASVAEAHADWPAVHKEILAADPLYSAMAIAQGEDGMFQLRRRAAINALFKDRSRTGKDLIEYADIALDLKVYGFAGLLYWNCFVAVPQAQHSDRALVEYFLYCLEELGVKDLKENFKGDHAAEFAKIRSQREKLK
jgi:hypothetical protein